ncbi:MAG: cytochrome c [Nitrospirae bacterium]|nr:cytochrome c [Nitrospirota bacterium]
MSTCRTWLLAAIGGFGIVAALTWAGVAPQESPSGYGLGRPAAEAEVRAWNIDVSPNGEGLPPGRGTAKQGAQVYAAKCAMCHGPTGVEGPMDRLVGGQRTLKTAKPIKTVGSYWPYATTLYDYIYRAMPYTAPQSLMPDEVYAVVAWILYRNGIIAEGVVMDATTLPAVRMPNRDSFVPDPRPDVPK